MASRDLPSGSIQGHPILIFPAGHRLIFLPCEVNELLQALSLYRMAHFLLDEFLLDCRHPIRQHLLQ